MLIRPENAETSASPVAGPLAANARRVLAIAYAFPPAAPIGTMRTLRLVKRLEMEGWSTTVLTVAQAHYPADMPLDDALLAQVPASVEILRAGIFRGLSAATRVIRPDTKATTSHQLPESAAAGGARRPPATPSLLRRIYVAVDELTSIPDKESGWLVPAIAAGLRSIIRNRPGVLYSSSPPWTGQLVALALARMTGVPWVADFRDPWARAPWRESQPARIRRASVGLERRVVERADAILFATRTNRDEYAAHYGSRLAHKFHVVCNGCDPQEFRAVQQLPVPTGQFVLLHAGSLYGARTPVPLFRAIAAALRSGGISRDGFRLRLIGAQNAAADFPSVAAALGVKDVVEFVPRMRRQEILDEMARASCLLVLQPGTTVSIPGKLYEYLAVGRPILALSEEGETSDLVRQSGLGIAVAPDDEAAIERALCDLVSNRYRALPPPPRHLYDGTLTAGEAVAIIEQIVRTRGSMRRPAEATATLRNM